MIIFGSWARLSVDDTGLEGLFSFNKHFAHILHVLLSLAFVSLALIEQM
jgi:hypothetical protein